jgi:hypothetical protein
MVGHVNGLGRDLIHETCYGSIDGITSNNCVAGKRHEIAARPRGGLGGWVACAEDLRAGGKHGIPASGVAAPRFLCVRVGAGADEIR